MQITFPGRHVLVTGAGRGIGRALVTGFLQAEAQVWAADLDPALLAQIAAAHPGAALRTAPCDVTDPQAVAALVARIEAVSPSGACDVVVHAAGGTRGQTAIPIEDVTDADWRALQAVNLDGAFHAVRAATPGMKRAGTGRIVFITSRAGLAVSRTGIVGYGTAKTAMVGLARQLAAELGPFGITVNTVAPGFMPTSPDYVRQWDSYGPEGQKALVEGTAMRRLGRPEDIASAALFLASDQAGWITGQTLAVTGGP